MEKPTHAPVATTMKYNEAPDSPSTFQKVSSMKNKPIDQSE